MKTPYAILAGLTLIALAIVAVGVSSRAGAAAGDQPGLYAVAAAPNFAAVVNTQTGDLRICILNGSCQDYKRQ
jgi:hypothetical protein